MLMGKYSIIQLKANQRAEVATVSLHLGSADNERCFRQVIFYLVIPVVF